MAQQAIQPVKLTKRQRELIGHLRDAGGRMGYFELALKMFPSEQYPRAWNYSSNGGPPGCYMQLSAMIRRLNIPCHGAEGKCRQEVHLPPHLR